MTIDLPGLFSLVLAATVLIAAAFVFIPILTSRSNEPKNPSDIES
jgi:archaellum component FlaF (FlaF/FlaG flagellin family)